MVFNRRGTPLSFPSSIHEDDDNIERPTGRQSDAKRALPQPPALVPVCVFVVHVRGSAVGWMEERPKVIYVRKTQPIGNKNANAKSNVTYVVFSHIQGGVTTVDRFMAEKKKDHRQRGRTWSSR